jgi:type VI secretion system protein ImpH
MATKSGSEAPPLTSEGGPSALVSHELREDPHSFQFFQAVRLLHRLFPDRAPVGRFARPEDEVVRFGCNPDLAFAAGELDGLEPSSEGPWKMTVNFMGLVGHMGVLPHHYSRLAMAGVRQRDPALLDFLDLFHHRLIALFYRAWERYRPYVAHELGEEDHLSAHLFDLVGLGSPLRREGMGPRGAHLLRYVGLLAPQQRSALALQQLLEDYFDVPLEVEQFTGGWYRVSQHARCALDDERPLDSTRLGDGALLGDEVWDPNSKARIVIGPLAIDRYREFLPGGDAYRQLRILTRFFADEEVEFEVKLILRRDEVPPIALGMAEQNRLAWSTWLSGDRLGRDASDTVLAL